MIPQRFVTEYPARCRQLLDMLEPQAREAGLLGSFALLVASAAINIPYGQITEKNHPLGRPEGDLSHAIKNLTQCPFLEAPFWNGNKPEFFRCAKIVNIKCIPNSWRNAEGVRPISSTETTDANCALKTIRHALAHGNVLYLDENGYETPNNKLCYLAFIGRKKNQIYHIVIFGMEDFLKFLKAWIEWLQKFPPYSEFRCAESAH